jgi:hypothetical protein
VYYPRLLRDGWKRNPILPSAEYGLDAIFEKQLPVNWVLRKIAHAQIGPPAGKGCYWDEHVLFHPQSGTEIKYPDWEWADLDNDRLVWAQAGKVWASKLSQDGLADQVELADLNSMAFEPIKAPY